MKPMQPTQEQLEYARRTLVYRAPEILSPEERALLRAAFPEPAKPSTLATLSGLPAPEPGVSLPAIRHLGNFAVEPTRSTGFTCTDCGVSWIGCAAAADCPECGTSFDWHSREPLDLAPYEVPGPLHDLLTSVRRAAADLEGSSPKGDRVALQLLTAMARFRAEVDAP